MERTRVKLLFEGGYKIGKKLKKSLLLTECVPGGTSTAFAVLSGLGINVNGLISGSHRNPPSELKIKLVLLHEQNIKYLIIFFYYTFLINNQMIMFQKH